MPFEAVCAGCGTKLYAGREMKPLDLVLRANSSKCRGCGRRLSREFTLEIYESPHLIIPTIGTSRKNIELVSR